jgi:uncharacterized membrane protein
MNLDFIKHSVRLRRAIMMFIALAAASCLCVLLVAVRFAYSGQFTYFNLIWNLFLAWLPLGFALFAVRFPGSRWRLCTGAMLWLLFLPNSPYLITDLVHLRPRASVPLWYDILLVQSFVLTGLLLGLLSLYIMHRFASRSHGWRIGWLFTLVILALTGFGIYLGRFERWNSWDVVASPFALMSDILSLLIHPRANKVAFVFSTICAVFLFLAYLAFYALATLHHDANPLMPKAPERHDQK